jgi:hypothetical protein
VPGHRTGKERIKLWISLGGSRKTKKLSRSPKQRNPEPVKQIKESRAVQSTSAEVIGTPLTSLLLLQLVILLQSEVYFH